MDRQPADLGMAALARTSSVGPYFAIQPWAAREQWRPLGMLVSDPVILAERVGHCRAILAHGAGIAVEQVEVRVAASIMFGGLTSQLVSPQLGAAVIAGVIPQLALKDLWW